MKNASTDRSRIAPTLYRAGLPALWMLLAVAGWLPADGAPADTLLAGVAKVDITDRDAGPVNDPLYVRALVLRHGTTTVALVSVDAVAIGEIGRIGNDYLPAARARLQSELGIPPEGVLINASHCHGVVCGAIAERTVAAVKQALQSLVPVHAGAGSGHEDRIMENRRFKLRNGREADERRAYAMPPDEDVVGIGPVDPEIGVLRLDLTNGRPLAVVYNFACHPIMGVPSGGNTADLTGFASRTIEEALGGGAVALFLQGCAGDINPVGYKDASRPHDAEPLGHRLGLSALRALQASAPRPGAGLTVIRESVALPRSDTSRRIAALEAERIRLVESLKGTSLNLKNFIPLFVKYRISGDFPSADSHRYLHERAMGRNDLSVLDDENRRNLEQYIGNILTMEELTRIQTTLAQLRKHRAANAAAATLTIEAEMLGLRVGDFVLLTFPGELSVQVGLNVKKRSPHKLTFIAGYSNGYIYYAPTADQLANPGAAQEDCDCILAPEWQRMFETKAAEMLKKL